MELDSLKSMTILFRAHQAIETYAKKDIQNHGLNLNEFSALEVLYHKGRLQVQGMCTQVLIPNSSMTYVLDKLEQKGFIERIQDKNDKRTFYVDLSEKGKSFTNEVIPRHYDHMRKLFNTLSLEDREVLNTLLKKVGYLAVSSIGE